MADKPLIPNMPKEPQLWDRKNLEESNQRDREEQQKASLTIAATMEWSRGLLWSLNENQADDTYKINVLEQTDKYNDWDISPDEITQLFYELLMNKKINDIEYDSLCNIVASNDTNDEFIEINLSSYLDREVEEIQEISELEPDNEKEEETIDENQEKENHILLEKFKDHPSFPILERFINIEVWEWKKMTLLTEPDLLKLSQHLGSWENPVSWLREWIKWIVFDDDRTQTVLNNYLYTVENINDSIKPDVDWLFPLPEEFKSEKYSILNEDLDNDIIQLLIKNYKKFPDWEDGNPNIEKDIFTSCEVTLNKIIENKNFPQTKMYDKAVHDVRNWDLESRIQALSYINSLVNRQEGIKWWKAKESIKNIKEAHNLTKTSYTKFKLEQIQNMLDTTTDKNEKQKLEWELSELLENINKNDHFEWEVFSSWKLDWEIQWKDSISENK